MVKISIQDLILILYKENYFNPITEWFLCLIKELKLLIFQHGNKETKTNDSKFRS